MDADEMSRHDLNDTRITYPQYTKCTFEFMFGVVNKIQNSNSSLLPETNVFVAFDQKFNIPGRQSQLQ